MNTQFYIAVGVLSGMGIFSGILLYFVAKQFHVEEDPRIEEVEKVLPGANCGACGFAGCRNFAEACVKSAELSAMFCPVGGNATMARVAQILGKTAIEKAPMIAVVRCNGCDEFRPRRNRFDAVQSCVIAHNHYQGETDCPYGCFGFGDCVRACQFGAIEIDLETGMPVVNEEKCTACGACVRACPRSLIEMRLKGPKGRRVYVRCMNKDKAVLTRKACAVGCIGCGKCMKTCPFEAVTVTSNLAYINYDKCKLCRKCVSVCPTKAIHEVHFNNRDSVGSRS